MIFIGIDPGSARMGWGVIDDAPADPEVVAYGCLETKSGNTDSYRLRLLFEGFNRLLDKYQPGAMGIEDLFFFKNQKTIVKVGQARGVALLSAELKGISAFSYTPPQIKLAVTGYGKADKRQVQMMTKTILKLDKMPKPDDTADALAVALTHSFSRKTIQQGGK